MVDREGYGQVYSNSSPCPIVSVWPSKHLFTKRLLLSFSFEISDPYPFSLVQNHIDLIFPD